MKFCEPFLLALLVLCGSTGFAGLEFSGYTKSAAGAKFVLTDTDQKKTSGWLTLGASFEDYTLVAFDQKAEVLSVKKDDTVVRLPFKSSHVRDAQERLAEFRSFFGQPRPLTAQDVEDRFGPPPRYETLLLSDTEKDVTREHSWWYYPLGPDESVGVQVDGAKVKGIYHLHPDPAGGVANEIIRQP